MSAEIDQLVARMERLLAPLEATADPRRHFLATYLRTTRAVAGEIDRGGFDDRAWVERWDVVFAELYLDAVEQHTRGETPSAPWATAFRAATDRPDLPMLRHLLLGMNAHINYDLPQALLAVIPSADFDDPALMARREADHRHVDDVLVARVEAEDRELQAAGVPRSLLDRVLTPLNKTGTKRFLQEARAKVWANTRALDGARRTGPTAYAGRLAELESLSAARIADLTAPGQVLLKLAVGGFGVRLPAASQSR
ncbi:MAG: DUF5995 family protein [Actinomycetota bacterium]|nr:DUF5995 family protein [Actinomycetota bacterium]